MEHKKILSKFKQRKKFAAVVIIILLSSILIWYIIVESIQLEFTIKIMEDSSDIINKCVHYQFRNNDDEEFYISNPEIGKSFDFFIKAQNGTVYQYGGAGPVTTGLPWWRNLSPGETEEGTVGFGYKMDWSYYLEFGNTNWRDPDTGENWFFQPGTYKIYGIYESKPNSNYENVLVGTWYSNEVTLTID